MSISRKPKYLPLILAGLAMGLSVFINVNDSKSIEPVEASVGSYATNSSSYYNDITATSGKELAGQLHDLITSTHRTYTTYADNGGNGYQKNTDQYYQNGSKVNGYIYEFYSGAKWSNEWVPNDTGGYNREHCWCQSNSIPSGSSDRLWGETGGGADMHHLRPVEKDLNSTRNNNLYGLVTNRDSYKKYPKMSNGNYSSSLGGYCNGGVFEPIDSKKGDVARIILYVYLHYNSYSITSLFGSYGTTNGNSQYSAYFATSLLPLTNTVSKSTEEEAIALMLDWNTSDPVDEIEQRRNEQVAIYQGNRNPFIDNSNYANLIWGNGTTPQPQKTLNSISVSGQNTTFTVGDTFAFNGTVTATYSDNSTANVTSSATFSGYNMSTSGNQTVSVSYTEGGVTKTTSYSITVNESSSSSTGSETITMSSQGFSDATDVTSISGSNCTITFAKGSGSTSPKYYNTGTAVRAYGGNTITIASSKNIVGVNFTFGSSDGSNAISVNTGTFSSPSWSGKANFITFTIGGTSGNRRIAAIEVVYESSGVVESISATPNKTFYVGETITKSDITVRDNLNNTITDFSFANNNYQFTYNDAASGGSLTNKTFVGAITYSSFNCSITVKVQRKAYDTPDDIEYTWDDFSSISGTSSNPQTNTKTIKGTTFTVTKSYKYNDMLSLKSYSVTGGYKTDSIIYNSTRFDGAIKTVTPTLSNAPSGLNTVISYSEDNDAWSTANNGKQHYFKISFPDLWSSGFINITSISVITNGVETPQNLANYIMFADTNNQCLTKLSVAIGYLGNLSSSDRTTFASSDNYVISNARIRLNAWAASQGKTINYSTATMSNRGGVMLLDQKNNNKTIILILVISVIGVSSVGLYLYRRKRIDN